MRELNSNVGGKSVAFDGRASNSNVTAQNRFNSRGVFFFKFKTLVAYCCLNRFFEAKIFQSSGCFREIDLYTDFEISASSNLVFTLVIS